MSVFFHDFFVITLLTGVCDLSNGLRPARFGAVVIAPSSNLFLKKIERVRNTFLLYVSC